MNEKIRINLFKQIFTFTLLIEIWQCYDNMSTIDKSLNKDDRLNKTLNLRTSRLLAITKQQNKAQNAGLMTKVLISEGSKGESEKEKGKSLQNMQKSIAIAARKSNTNKGVMKTKPNAEVGKIGKNDVEKTESAKDVGTTKQKKDVVSFEQKKQVGKTDPKKGAQNVKTNEEAGRSESKEVENAELKEEAQKTKTKLEAGKTEPKKELEVTKTKEGEQENEQEKEKEEEKKSGENNKDNMLQLNKIKEKLKSKFDEEKVKLKELKETIKSNDQRDLAKLNEIKNKIKSKYEENRTKLLENYENIKSVDKSTLTNEVVHKKNTKHICATCADIEIAEANLEKRFFSVLFYVDKFRSNKDVDKKMLIKVRLKNEGIILGTPTAILFLGFLFFINPVTHWGAVGFGGVSFIMYVYIIIKTLKYQAIGKQRPNPGFMDYMKCLKNYFVKNE
ncbi:Plasmodium exported protein (Pm-fam-a like), unknown function [Plasmodium ovale wallikeri]|uniref:Pv-fam-b protein n=2 Tax=Plasmodium ovale TaxID=36330 RepID=A0A1A9AHE4_PLAOA|nr:Plasmodium exported protein (Pm-fam-a like), unknown function [Plasmodium ovale wallikeri]SBT55581.1 Plasmodium exported protein (Pm-fam-a like), unknown function [Plasmodium ovale wallikeri]SBT75591.1 Plasmodium exported protein, unknown function [Plasmodium ovale]